MFASRDIRKGIVVNICEKKSLKCESVVTTHNRHQVCAAFKQTSNERETEILLFSNDPSQIEFSLLVIPVLFLT